MADTLDTWINKIDCPKDRVNSNNKNKMLGCLKNDMEGLWKKVVHKEITIEEYNKYGAMAKKIFEGHKDDMMEIEKRYNIARKEISKQTQQGQVVSTIEKKESFNLENFYSNVSYIVAFYKEKNFDHNNQYIEDVMNKFQKSVRQEDVQGSTAIARELFGAMEKMSKDIHGIFGGDKNLKKLQEALFQNTTNSTRTILTLLREVDYTTTSEVLQENILTRPLFKKSNTDIHNLVNSAEEKGYIRDITQRKLTETRKFEELTQWVTKNGGAIATNNSYKIVEASNRGDLIDQELKRHCVEKIRTIDPKMNPEIQKKIEKHLDEFSRRLSGIRQNMITKLMGQIAHDLSQNPKENKDALLTLMRNNLPLNYSGKPLSKEDAERELDRMYQNFLLLPVGSREGTLLAIGKNQEFLYHQSKEYIDANISRGIEQAFSEFIEKTLKEGVLERIIKDAPGLEQGDDEIRIYSEINGMGSHMSDKTKDTLKNFLENALMTTILLTIPVGGTAMIVLRAGNYGYKAVKMGGTMSKMAQLESKKNFEISKNL